MTNNSNNNNATEVKRNLRSRHISMIAIGGCIGSGLFMTSGQAIHSAGPGGGYCSLSMYRTYGIFLNDITRGNGNISSYIRVI